MQKKYHEFLIQLLLRMEALLVTLSTILVTIAPITYIASITRGKTKPHRMTRFILSFVLAINFISIVSAHGNIGAKVFAGIIFVQAVIIFLMSLWRGMGGKNKLDIICLGIAVVGVVGWKVTGNPIIGMLFSIIADFFAYLPAFIKTWKYPHTESAWFYLLGTIAAILGLFAYKVDASSLFQIYIALNCLVMIAFIYRKNFLKSHNKK